MHDIDRTQLESDFEMENFEYEQFEAEEGEGVFNETQEMELAAELMEVRDEQELEQFLGSLVKKASRALGSVMRSPIGNAIGGVLKSVAKRAIPLAGTALGGFVGGPIGAQIGRGLASTATSALGFEMENFEQEDHEFEGAKQFVRLAGSAVKNGLGAGSPADPRTAAQYAVGKAVRTFAPNLLRPATTAPAAPHFAAPHFAAPHFAAPTVAMAGGRWVRRGNKIILFGV